VDSEFVQICDYLFLFLAIIDKNKDTAIKTN
jgi:hypothetical protein